MYSTSAFYFNELLGIMVPTSSLTLLEAWPAWSFAKDQTTVDGEVASMPKTTSYHRLLRHASSTIIVTSPPVESTVNEEAFPEAVTVFPPFVVAEITYNKSVPVLSKVKSNSLFLGTGEALTSTTPGPARIVSSVTSVAEDVNTT